MFRAQTIDLRLKLLAGLKHAVDLEYLGVDHAAANVIVYPDGSTNLPEPKVVTKSNKSALETVVDLAIHKFEITNTSLTFAEQRIPLVARGGDLRSQLFYRSIPADYTGRASRGRVAGCPRDGCAVKRIAGYSVGDRQGQYRGERRAAGDRKIADRDECFGFPHEFAADRGACDGACFSRRGGPDGGRGAEALHELDTLFRGCGFHAAYKRRQFGDARFKLDVGSSELSGSADADRAVHFVGRIAAAELGRLLGERSVPEITVQANGKARMAANQLAISSSISTGEFGMGAARRVTRGRATAASRCKRISTRKERRVCRLARS